MVEWLFHFDETLLFGEFKLSHGSHVNDTRNENRDSGRVSPLHLLQPASVAEGEPTKM